MSTTSSYWRVGAVTECFCARLKAFRQSRGKNLLLKSTCYKYYFYPSGVSQFPPRLVLGKALGTAAAAPSNEGATAPDSVGTPPQLVTPESFGTNSMAAAINTSRPSLHRISPHFPLRQAWTEHLCEGHSTEQSLLSVPVTSTVGKSKRNPGKVTKVTYSAL